jgi:hypothetical protein
MAEHALVGGHPEGLAATVRRDRWWAEPMATGLGFLAFVVYANWAAFQGDHYYAAPYLSPFFEPLFFVDPSRAGAAPLEHAWFGAWPDWMRSVWPSFVPSSPAWLILAGPLSFRLTCYYYRKFYYRSYFLTPPACAVRARPQKYKGETALFVFQNLHRYTLYVAIGFIVMLYVGAFKSFVRDGQFGVGVGSIVLLANATLLAGYTFGCHAFRHLVGGRLDCFSCDAMSERRHGLWGRVTWLNGHHMLWAWVSMIAVGLADLYVRLLSMGVIRDLNTWD